MKSKIKLIEIEHDKEGYHYFVTIEINGKKANFLVDTGATHTVMDKTRSKAFVKNVTLVKNESLSTGLGTSNMESHKIVLKSLMLGKAKFKKFEMVLMDLSHVNESYQSLGQDPLDGVLGNNILRKLNARICLLEKGAHIKIEF